MADKITSIDKIVQSLISGDVAAIPTETVYGLAACVFNESAIKKIFHLKNRPFFDPLIVHIAAISDVDKVALKFSKPAQLLAKAFWPGPLTIILPKKETVSDLVTSGLPSVGVRLPDHPMTIELIKKVGQPLAAPSANQFKKTSPTTADHVLEEFKEDQFFVLDGGQCKVGLESTVIGVIEEPNEIIVEQYRLGAISETEIQSTLKLLNKKISFKKKSNPAAPGQLEHHYMPNIPIVIFRDENHFESKKSKLPKNLKNYVDLILDKNPQLAARQLYSEFRTSAQSGKSYIRVLATNVPSSGIGEAIWDRLNKAATFNFIDGSK